MRVEVRVVLHQVVMPKAVRVGSQLKSSMLAQVLRKKKVSVLPISKPVFLFHFILTDCLPFL